MLARTPLHILSGVPLLPVGMALHGMVGVESLLGHTPLQNGVKRIYLMPFMLADGFPEAANTIEIPHHHA